MSPSETVSERLEPKLRLPLGERLTTSPVDGSILLTVRQVATLEFSDSEVNTSSEMAFVTVSAASTSRPPEEVTDLESSSLSSLEGGGRHIAESEDDPTEY